MLLDENIEKKMPYLIDKLKNYYIKEYDLNIDPKEIPDIQQRLEKGAKRDIQYISKADPICVKSEGKKTPFVNQILNWFITGKIRLPEDIETVRDTLTQYTKYHNKLKGIEHYHSPGELRKALEQFAQEHQGKQEYPEEVVDTIPGFKLIRIDNWEQGEVCFRDSGWCVQKPEYFENYKPPYFMVVKDGGNEGKDKRYALIHVESEQIKDVQDDPLTPELAEPIKKFLKELFHEQLKQYAGIKGVTYLIHIMNSDSSDGDYSDLQQLLPVLVPKELFLANPQVAYLYAQNILQHRWPEAEPEIVKSKWAIYYAANVIHGRWPEAEPYILQSSEYATQYACLVMRGPWPEAEPVILKDPDDCLEYIRFALKREWPEAEPIMKTNPRVWKSYQSYLNYIKYHQPLQEQLREIFKL